MAIELIDKIKQKNNGGFKLVDADDVDWDVTGEKSVKERIEELEWERLPFAYFDNSSIETLNYNLWAVNATPAVL